MPVLQQLPQVTFFYTRHPDPRKPLFHQQIQQVLGIPLVRQLLLARVLPMNSGCISNPQLLLQPRQQTLEPQHVPAALHTHQHWSAQRLVESLGFPVAVVQPAFGHLTCFCVQHSNLLKARMIITAYNLHIGSFRPRASWSLNNQSVLGFGGSRRCHQIKRSPSDPAKWEARTESKDPENLSLTMQCQGVLTRTNESSIDE